MALEGFSFFINVKPDPVEKKSKGGIILTMNERQEMGATTRGTILAIGEDAWSAYKPKRVHAGLQVGDRVFYAKYAGKLVQENEDSEPTLILRDEDIVGKIAKEIE